MYLNCLVISNPEGMSYDFSKSGEKWRRNLDYRKHLSCAFFVSGSGAVITWSLRKTKEFSCSNSWKKSYEQQFTNSLSRTFSATKSPFKKGRFSNSPFFKGGRGDFWLFPPFGKGGTGGIFQFVNFWWTKGQAFDIFYDLTTQLFNHSTKYHLRWLCTKKQQ